jgi:serine/threonine protein kinase
MVGGERGHFFPFEKIGEGGMGRAYKARDKRHDRFVAIKLLAEAPNAAADRRARFVEEAEAALALSHPNVISIHKSASRKADLPRHGTSVRQAGDPGP